MDQHAHESRLFETVRFIREWIEGSFEPTVDERFRRSGGRLKARFDVDLGPQMCEQLKVYAKASFALSKLQFVLTEREAPGGKKRPCVEVLLTEEARNLYAEKCPDAVAKRRAAHNGRALQDTASVERVTPPAVSDEQARLPLANGPAVPSKAENAPDSTQQLVTSSGITAGSDKGRRTEGKRAKVSELATAAKAAVSASAAHVGKGPKRLLDESNQDSKPKQHRHEKNGAGTADGCAPTPSTSSIWQSVEAHAIPPGADGLRQAKEALEASLNYRIGLNAFKAEKEAVSWLKGLVDHDVGAAELRSTLIGQAVNAWRKHPEPFVASLATSLVRKWRATWREADTETKQRSPKGMLALAEVAAN